MIRPESFSKFSQIDAGFCNAKESLELKNPILMKKVHSAYVLVLTETPAEPPQCDALVTRTPGLKLTIKTADCAPVLFIDPVANVIGAAHAGWKGAFQGVLENTILTMLKLGATIDHIRAAIGPHLTQKSFQVAADMQNLFPKTEQHFFASRETGSYFDFTGYIQHRLQRASIQTIDSYPIDTFSDPAYNSYRREAESHARQYSFIQLTKGA